MAHKSTELATLRQRAIQYLVHSFLYYKLGESVVGDAFYDAIVEELRHLRAKHPKARMPYAEVIDPQLGAEASGFAIREYPPHIISTAFKLLYASGEPEVDFTEFVERQGYRVEFTPAG